MSKGKPTPYRTFRTPTGGGKHVAPAVGEWASRSHTFKRDAIDESLGWAEANQPKPSLLGVPATFEVPVVPVTRTRPDMDSLITEWARADAEMPTVHGMVRFEDWLVAEAWRRRGANAPLLAILRDPMGNVALARV